MGQTTSAIDTRLQVRGGIYISLDKTYFISNEVITGFLNIKVDESFSGHNLILSVEGFEETHFINDKQAGCGPFKQKQEIYSNGLNIFLSFSIPIYDFSNGKNSDNFVLQPGQSKIPFSLTVGDLLPSTMTYFTSFYERCHIKYRLVASIIPTDNRIKPIQGIQEIFIGQQFQEQNEPKIVNAIPIPVISCCLVSGNMQIQAILEKSSFSPNENIKVQLNCDFSNYKKNIKSLTFALKCNLYMRSTNALAMKHIPYTVSNFDVQVEGKKFQKEILIPISTGTSFSCIGNLISLEYYLQISPNIDTKCCVTTNTPLFIPIIINPTSVCLKEIQLPQLLQVQPPENWNPTILMKQEFSDEQAASFQKQEQLFMVKQFELYNQQMVSNIQYVNSRPAMVNQNQIQS